MTTANKITLVRIAMIPFFIWFALQDRADSQIVALVLFCAHKSDTGRETGLFRLIVLWQ